MLAEKIIMHLLGVVGLNKDDIILTSYPRSGSTWVRFFLCNLISLSEWGGRVVDFEILDRTMPEFGSSNLIHPWPHHTIPRIVKTHKRYLPFFRKLKAMQVIRDPRDVMVSYFFYLRGRQSSSQNQFSDFIRNPKHGLQAWFVYHKSWERKDKAVFRYEDLMCDDLKQFVRMVSFLEVDVPESLIQEAVMRSRFKEVKSIEIEYGNPKCEEYVDDSAFTRKGVIGEWKRYFTADDICGYQKLVSEYALKEFTYS
jgi:hypothetical protein